MPVRRRCVSLDDKTRGVPDHGQVGRYGLRRLGFAAHREVTRHVEAPGFDNRDIGEKPLTATGDSLTNRGFSAESPNACRILLIALLRP